MHEIANLWIRPVKRAVPVPQPSLTLVASEGVEGDHKLGGRRHVTIVFADDWAGAVEDLGIEVDPLARRANVLVSGGSGARYVGRRMRLGDTEIEIKGIVDPCARMDEAAEGLQEALKPDGRGGIWGVVLTGGTIRPGDRLEAVEEGSAE